jgi:hypothetical protein
MVAEKMFPNYMAFDYASTLYYELLTDDVRDSLYPWEHWEVRNSYSDDMPSFQPPQYPYWITIFYIYVIFRFAPFKREDQIDVPQSEVSRTISNRIIESFNQIDLNPNWKNLFDQIPNFEMMKEILIEKHKQAAKTQKFLEDEKIINKEIDASKKKKIIIEIRESWMKHAKLRQIATAFGVYQEKQDVVPSEGRFPIPINEVIPKSYFIGNEDKKLGEIYGKKLASFEDSLLSYFFLDLEVIDEGINLDNISKKLPEIIHSVVSSYKKPVILTDHSLILGLLHQVPDFQKFDSDNNANPIPGVEGKLGDAFVFQINGVNRNEVVIIDMKNFGTLVQYPTNEDGQGPIKIEVIELSKELAREELKSDPSIDLDAMTEEEINIKMRELRKKVIIRILNNVTFENVDPSAGKRIKFSLR